MIRSASTLSLLLLAAVFGVPVARVAESAPIKAGPVPREAAPAERRALSQGALMLSKGEFQRAADLLAPLEVPPVARVYVDWTPVPKPVRAGYRGAVERAFAAWNAGLGGTVQFQTAAGEEEAQVVLLFERHLARLEERQLRFACADGAVEAEPAAAGGSRRVARIRISLFLPHTEVLHPADSITHLAGQGLGLYLGLSQSGEVSALMGPDTHNAAMALKPSEQEVRVVKELQALRAQLLASAQKREEVRIAAPAIVVEKMEIDAGDVWRGDSPRYVFTIRNTGDAPLEVEAKPNCGCVVPNYDRAIQPGREGKIEASMVTLNLRGRVLKVIDVQSNDPEKPLVSLRLAANIRSVIQVLPNENPYIPLKDEGPTVREFELRIGGTEPIEITRVTCSAVFATATAEPLAGAAVGRAYKVTLTVQPQAPAGRSAFVVTALTSSAREPQVNITATCEKGILVTPALVYMGAVTATTRLPLTQIVTLQKREGGFQIRKVQSSDPKLEVETKAVQPGARYQLTFTYRGGWPEGVVRTRVVVETDDPRQPTVEIPVMASVAAGGASK